VGAASIIVSGCGPFGSSESAPTGYLTHGSDAAVFLQWTRVGDSLTGTWTEAYIHPSDPAQVHALQQNVSGSIDGSSVTLTFGSGTIEALSGKVVTGTFSSSDLTLSYPTPNGNGSLSAVTFSPSDVGGYNAAVRNLQALAARTRATSVAVQATTDAGQAEQQARQAIDQDASRLQSDQQSLSTDKEQPATDLRPIAKNLQTEQQDLATTHSDEQLALAEMGQSNSGGDATAVQADALAVANDAQAADNDANQVKGDLDRIRSDIASIQSDLQ
jgi:hypothetical protein